MTVVFPGVKLKKVVRDHPLFEPNRNKEILMEVLARRVEEFLDPDQDHSSETAGLTYLSLDSKATDKTFLDRCSDQTRRLWKGAEKRPDPPKSSR